MAFASFLAVDARAGSPDAYYEDPVGEVEFGPDIASVVVTQATPAEISLAIRFANRSLRADELLAIDFDTDLEDDTGDDGSDVGVEVFGGETTLWRWRQSSRGWDHVVSDALESRWDSTTLIVTVSFHDLGSPDAFRFSVFADANPDDKRAPADLAPAWGRWRYPPAEEGSMNWPLFGLLMSVIVVGTIGALFVPGSIDALRAPGWRMLKSPVLWPFAAFALVALVATVGGLWGGTHPDESEGELFRSNLMGGAVLGAIAAGVVFALLGAQFLRRRSGASSFEAVRLVVRRSLDGKTTRRGSEH
jgi:hypothetical protein